MPSADSSSARWIAWLTRVLRSPIADGPRPNGVPPTTTAAAANAAPNSTAPSRPIYPWSKRRIALPPPLYLPRPGAPPPTGPSPTPFPRYGHSLPMVASQTGEIFLFGGLVREIVRNDLYTFNTRDLSATLVQTMGEVPRPRVGHASALVSSVLIVWGGDTKQRDDDKHDEGLYLLNLGSREWTAVATKGSAPAGRYGHSVAMCGSRFFVFGGQVDGEFLNDLWCFDLNTREPLPYFCSTLANPPAALVKTSPLWELVSPVNKPPPRRTGHIMVSLGDIIYMSVHPIALLPSRLLLIHPQIRRHRRLLPLQRHMGLQRQDERMGGTHLHWLHPCTTGRPCSSPGRRCHLRLRRSRRQRQGPRRPRSLQDLQCVHPIVFRTSD